MNTPSTPSPQSASPVEELCNSLFEYRDRLLQSPDRKVSLRTIELDHRDGDISIYDAAGTFLACERGRDEALREAEFVITAYVHDARWAVQQLAACRGHLQRHFPEIAARHGCPPAEAVRPSSM